MSNTHSLDLERSSTQYASISDASQTGLDFTGDFTIEAWIKLEQLPSTAGGNMVIVSKDDVNNRCYNLDIKGSDDKLSIQYFSGGSVNRHQMNLAFDSGDVGTWVHVAVSVDVSAETATFYKNGSSQASTYAIDSNGTSVDDDPAEFRIGAQGNNAQYFDGLIDEVRVWNDIRTSGEIASNYQTELTGSESNLQGYWKLNNNYTDETSNGNDLTGSGSPVFSTDVPIFSSGQTAQTVFMGSGL